MTIGIVKTVKIGKHYTLYSDGRVWNDKYNRWLKGGIDSSGYRQVRIDGKLHLLHRLVALAFIPNPDNLPEVNHKDFDRLNCDASNLEWASREANLLYSKERRRLAQAKHYTFVNPDGEIVHIHGLNTFCKANGLDTAAMQRVHSGKNNHHKGWKRYEDY